MKWRLRLCKIARDLAFDNKFYWLVHDVVYVLTLKSHANLDILEATQQ